MFLARLARTASLVPPALAVLVLGALAPSDASALGPTISAQAGMTLSNYSFDEGGVDVEYESGRVGWAIGGNLQFGGKIYVAPGLYYQKTGFEATATDDVTLETVTDDVGVHALHLPVLVGYRFSFVPGTRSSGLRAYAGPSVTTVTSVDDNEFGIEKDDYVDTIFGGVIGVGFDLTRITFDLNYEIGGSEVFHEGDSVRENVLRGLVGLKF